MKLCLFIFILLVVNAIHAQQTFYISIDGDDSWSGKLPNATATKDNGPFKTFDRALQEIARLRSDKSFNESIFIEVRQGTYTFDKTLRINEAHSGNKTHPTVWKNYDKEKVQLIGGKRIENMHRVTNHSLLQRLPANAVDSVFQIDLASIGITHTSEIQKRGSPGVELFFDNQRMTPARWPNEGWALIADVPQSGELVYKGELPHMRFGMPVGKHYGRITYNEDRPKYWSNIPDIVLHGYWVWDWFDEYLKIESIDTTTKEINFKAPHSHYGYCKQQRYYALNVVEELDRPGEWYIDRSQNVVLFWPPSGSPSSELFISQLEEPLIQLDSCSNLRIEGFDLKFSQGNGIVINGGENNLVAGCTFSQLGDIAVRITGGKNNGLQSCDIKNIALGGVVLAGGNRKTLEAGKNFVVNCHIHDIGEWIRTYQSAITISGVGNYIAHNNIHDGPGTGILLTGNEHLLEYNELHHLALETGDVGAFYMGRDWTERGNVIRYNYFHDLTGPGAHDVNAVYLDDWASGTTVKGNIFSNCARGIMIGGGRDNIVDNNLFMDCRPSIHVDSRGLGWAKYYFDGTNKTLFNRMDSMNYTRPPYSKKYPALLSLYRDEPAIAKNNSIMHNISYRGRWMDLHDGLTFETVKCKQNLVADAETGPVSEKDKRMKGNPGITDYQNQNFMIKPAGLTNGYKNIQWSKIGLQGDRFRKLKEGTRVQGNRRNE